MRRFVKLAFVSALSVVLLPSALFAKDKKQEEAEALLRRARKLSDIRCDGCPAFNLKASVVMHPPVGDAGGMYMLT